MDQHNTTITAGGEHYDFLRVARATKGDLYLSNDGRILRWRFNHCSVNTYTLVRLIRFTRVL